MDVVTKRKKKMEKYHGHMDNMPAIIFDLIFLAAGQMISMDEMR